MEPGEDSDTRLVYADYLQSIEDPRGLLIALQHARAQASGSKRLEDAARAENQLLHEEAGRFYQSIDPSHTALSWRLGFVHSAYLGNEAKASDLQNLLESESGRMLRYLDIDLADDEDEGKRWPAFAALLRDTQLLGLSIRSARALALGPMPPSLGQLRIEAPAVSECAGLSSLSTLRLELESLPDLEHLGISWPRLHSLTLRVGDAAERVSLWLGRTALPALRDLTLFEGQGSSEQLCTALAAAPCFSGLRSLDLRCLGITGEGALTLASAADGAAMQILNLDGNRLQGALAELSALACDVHYGSQSGTGGTLALAWGRPLRHRELYTDPQFEFASNMGAMDGVREAKRRGGLEAALQSYDEIPPLSVYRLGAEGGELVVQMLKLLGKEDHYESILQLCRETPLRRKSQLIWLHEMLAHILCNRPEEALRAASRVHAHCFLDWASALTGERAAHERLVADAGTRKGDRWQRYAAAHVLREQDPDRARKFLDAALRDVMPVSPRLPCKAVSRRLFASSPSCLSLLG